MDAAADSPQPDIGSPLEPKARPRRLGRNLPAAIVVGLTLAAIFLTSLFLSHWAFLGFVAILVVIALTELDGAFRGQAVRPATPVAVGAGLVMFFGAYTNGESGQSLGLVLLATGGAGWVLLDRHRRNVVASLGATFLMGLWVPLLASYLGLLLRRPSGEWYVVVAIALAVTNDIGAYAAGIRLGRHKLAPTVSPGKTWEGFVGGMVATLLVAVLVIVRIVPSIDVLAATVLAVAIALVATLGDLSESLVKRDLGLKDLGRILPGHGGVMDRVDAILFAAPTAHFVLLLLGI